MIIDFQHHFVPEALLPEGAADKPFTRFDENGVPSYSFHGLLVDLDAHIEMMDVAGIDAATSAADASEEQYIALTQHIKLATGEHYVQVLRSESALAVARSNVASLEAHTAIAENRYRTGEVPQNVASGLTEEPMVDPAVRPPRVAGEASAQLSLAGAPDGLTVRSHRPGSFGTIACTVSYSSSGLDSRSMTLSPPLALM